VLRRIGSITFKKSPRYSSMMVHAYVTPAGSSETHHTAECSLQWSLWRSAVFGFKVTSCPPAHRKAHCTAFLFISFPTSSALLSISASYQANQPCTVCQIDSVATLTRFGTYSYHHPFLAGLVTLAYMILGVKSIKTYWLLWSSASSRCSSRRAR